MPVAQFLGFRWGPRSEELAEVALPMREEFLQIDDRLHGGIVATLADTAAVWLFAPQLAEGQDMTSIEFKLNFLRPTVLGGGDLRAVARCVRLGRRIALGEVEVFQSDRAVSKGLYTYLISGSAID